MEIIKYVAPGASELEFYPEGLLCSSNELLEENEGEW